MWAYIFRRLITSVIVVVLVSIVVFFTIHMMPGDPLLIYLPENADWATMGEQRLEELRHEFGLDKPLPLQYIYWFGDILHGDFGTSINYNESVGVLMLERFPVTFTLGVQAFLVSAIFGILVGLASGLRRGRWLDVLTTVLAYLGIAIPVFWLAILMVYTFGLKLNWLPIYGYVFPWENFWESARHSIMPVICLAVTNLAITARQMRSSILEVMPQDYIRTAWAKGLKESEVVTRHALKNSLMPVVTIIGMNSRVIFGGSVFVESVFTIPGIGMLLVGSIFGHDYMVLQSISFVIALIIVLINLVVDISYGWIDPRIRYT